MTKNQIEEIVEECLTRQQQEYQEWLRDDCHMAGIHSWIGSTANDIAFEIYEALKEGK